MSTEDLDDFSNLPLVELFRIEVESQAAVLTNGLLELERDPSSTRRIEELMRSAHSLKGAARIVNRESAVRLAHAMEDCFLAAQRGNVVLGKPYIDLLLLAVDLLTRSAHVPDATLAEWEAMHRTEVQAITTSLSAPPPSEEATAPILGAPNDTRHPEATSSASEPAFSVPQSPSATQGTSSDLSNRVLRIAPESFSRLLGLSAETVVASHWLDTFAGDLLRIRRLHSGLNLSLTRLYEALATVEADERFQARFSELQSLVAHCHETLTRKSEEFERFEFRFAGLAKRLYQGVLDCRMRPFSDGVRAFPRMVRDVAHSLGKQVRLEIVGESTLVDRDILERLDAPLGHLLRNSVDHGIEPPADRRDAGKPEEGVIRLEASHRSGMLFITVTDDGRGVDIQKMRQALVRKNLATPEVAKSLTESELVEFLFLPGFTMKESVTDISGRGVGLDVVHVMAKEIGGSVRVSPQPGRGMKIELRLPLTLSVLRALLVEISGEPYAFPLARIASVVKIAKGEIHSVEGREHFTLSGQQVGLVAGQQILGLNSSFLEGDELPVIVIGDSTNRFGVVVDRFIGEEELVVRPLDPRLGAVKDISAAALLSDQSPVLIVDVEGMIRSIESLVSGDRLAHVRRDAGTIATTTRKRVLVVEDSLTVRELERKLLDNHGYEVDVAVDGMEGWNALRTRHYDLVITDVDMPRLDGIELIRLIRKDIRLRSLPVMVVSYKDREEDRHRGLEAGADYYVAKGSFHHEALLEAVADLIGKAVT